MMMLGRGAIWDGSNGVMEDQRATERGGVGQTIGPVQCETMSERETCHRHRGTEAFFQNALLFPC
jgi:hypothetical protein